jgi:exosortase
MSFVRKPGLWVAAALFAVVYAPTLLWLGGRWSMGVWWQIHGFAVFPLAIWLAGRRLRALRPRPPSSSALGFLFLVPAVLFQVLDAMLRFELLSAFSLLLALPGLSLLLLGRERTRAIWFPLLFLGFALPIPLLLARPVHLLLRQIAAVGTERALALLGYDIRRSGFNLQLGPEGLEIADACSGFSTLMALFMVGLLLAYVSRARWWRGAVLTACVFPAAIAANLARCIVLAMLAAAFGGQILDTWIHSASGIATFAVAFVMLLRVERLVLREATAC